MQLKPIREQRVVVMGASSGIGRLTALQFARRGAKVVISARSHEGLDSLVREIEGMGGTALAVEADVTQFDQVKHVADQAAERFGGIDTWVHLSAVALYAELENTTPEEFKQVIDTDLTGVAYGAMAALPHLRRQAQGALILLSSVVGRRAVPYQSAYSAAKHGILGFADALRLELLHSQSSICVTTILPPSVNTPFFEKARTKIGVQPKGLPPIYDPQAIVKAILFAAENPVRELAVGGAAKAMVIGQRLSPALMDTLVLKMGFDSQRSDQPKREDAPDNLFGPIGGYNRIRGQQYSSPSSMHPEEWMSQSFTELPSRLNSLLSGVGGMTMVIAGVTVGVMAGLLSQRKQEEKSIKLMRLDSLNTPREVPITMG